jgi:uncharacterized delta-60 repeat protein
MKLKAFIPLLLLVILKHELSAQPGSLDTTFGNGGIVLTSIVGDWDQGHAINMQDNGKIVVGANIGLVRYNADGTIDSTFGSRGHSISDWGYASTIQPDGKILLAGVFGEDFALSRYNKDGSPDKNFGNEGKVITDFGTYDYGWSVLLLPEGKILVAGNSNWNLALACYKSDGSLDLSFGKKGKVIVKVGSLWNLGISTALQDDGKIIVTGGSMKKSDWDFTIFRFHPDGSPDKKFGSRGKLMTDFHGKSEIAYSVHILPEGKFLVTGSCDTSFALARYNSNGKLDKSFGSNGVATASPGKGYAIPYASAVMNNGKIILTGQVDRTLAVMRFNSDGSIDKSFGKEGVVLSDVGEFGCATAIVIKPDGKFVVTGRCKQPGHAWIILVMQFNND